MCSSDDRNTAVPEPSASAPGPDVEAPASSSDVRGAAVPPILDPASFDHHEGFRETTLALFTEPHYNQALRVLGDLLYTLGGPIVLFSPLPQSLRQPEFREDGAVRAPSGAVVRSDPGSG